MAIISTEYDEVWGELYGKRMKLFERRADLEAELSDVSNQISHLSDVLSHLRPLAGLGAGESIVNLGITDAIRWILCDTEGRMSPTDVRDKLLEKGYDMSSLTVPMSSIYKILSRLAGGNEPEVMREKEDNSVFYRWIRKPDEVPF